jgi:hypothetical protein
VLPRSGARAVSARGGIATGAVLYQARASDYLWPRSRSIISRPNAFTNSFSLVKLQLNSRPSTIRITYPDQNKDPARCPSWLGRSAQCRIIEQSSVEFNSRVAAVVHRRSKVVLDCLLVVVCSVSCSRCLYSIVVAGVRASHHVVQSRRYLLIRPGLRQCDASLMIYQPSGILKL